MAVRNQEVLKIHGPTDYTYEGISIDCSPLSVVERELIFLPGPDKETLIVIYPPFAQWLQEIHSEYGEHALSHVTINGLRSKNGEPILRLEDFRNIKDLDINITQHQGVESWGEAFISGTPPIFCGSRSDVKTIPIFF